MIYFASCYPGFETNLWNDFSAIVVGGVYHTRHVFIMDIFRDRVETEGLIDALYHVNERWKPVTISIEATSAGTVMQYGLREAQRIRGFMPWRMNSLARIGRS